MLTLPITIEKLISFFVSAIENFELFERSFVLAFDDKTESDEEDDPRPMLDLFAFVTIVSRNSSMVERLERIRFLKLKLFSGLLLQSSSFSASNSCFDFLH